MKTIQHLVILEVMVVVVAIITDTEMTKGDTVEIETQKSAEAIMAKPAGDMMDLAVIGIVTIDNYTHGNY